MDGPGETRAPHVAVHLCIVFNVLFIYIGMPPRTNLVLDDAYNDHVYGAPRASIGGALTARVHACADTQSEGSDTTAASGHVPLSLSPLSSHVSRTCSPAPDPPQPGKSLNDMHVECVENKKFKQYVSKVRVRVRVRV